MSIAEKSRPASSKRRRRSSMPSASVLRVHDRGACGLGEDRRRRERAPAVAVLRHDALAGGHGVAADPDRRMRPADRPRMGSDALGGEVQSLIARSRRSSRCRGSPPALPRTTAARSSKSTPSAANSRFEIADADREREPTLRQQIQRRAGLGHHERIPVRQHHDVGDQSQRRRAGRGEAHRHERVDRVVAARLQPSLRWRRMVGEPETIETRPPRPPPPPSRCPTRSPAPRCTDGCASDG